MIIAESKNGPVRPVRDEVRVSCSQPLSITRLTWDSNADWGQWPHTAACVLEHLRLERLSETPRDFGDRGGFIVRGDAVTPRAEKM